MKWLEEESGGNRRRQMEEEVEKIGLEKEDAIDKTKWCKPLYELLGSMR